MDYRNKCGNDNFCEFAVQKTATHFLTGQQWNKSGHDSHRRMRPIQHPMLSFLHYQTRLARVFCVNKPSPAVVQFAGFNLVWTALFRKTRSVST